MRNTISLGQFLITHFHLLLENIYGKFNIRGDKTHTAVFHSGKIRLTVDLQE